MGPEIELRTFQRTACTTVTTETSLQPKPRIFKKKLLKGSSRKLKGHFLNICDVKSENILNVYSRLK